MAVTKNGQEIKMLFGTGASSRKDYAGLACTVRAAVSGGIRGFDTAPSYRTESLLGKCLCQCMEEFGLAREDLFVQTKVDAWQMMEPRDRIRAFVEEALEKLGLSYLDALLIHWPVPEYFDKTWECMAGMRAEGIVRYIGVCNVRMRQLRRFPGYECVPQIVQIERHPLRVCSEEVGFCREHGMDVQAYSPLCKMHPDIRDSEIIRRMAEKYDRDAGQIILRWHMDTGAAPVFTSMKEARVRQYADIGGFTLRREDMEEIESLNRDYKMYLEACACPGF